MKKRLLKITKFIFLRFSFILVILICKNAFAQNTLEKERVKIFAQYPSNLEARKKAFLVLNKKALQQNNEEIYFKTLIHISSINNKLNNYEEAIKLSDFTVEEAKKRNNKIAEMLAYGELSIAYSSLELHKRSKEYIDKALEIQKNIKEINDSMQHIKGNVYFYESEYYGTKRDFKNSLKSYKKSLKEYEKIKNSKKRNLDLLVNYSNLAKTYKYLDETDSMYYYSKKALELDPIKNNKPVILSKIYYHFGAYFYAKGNYKLAETYFLKCLDIINTTTKDTSLKAATYEQMGNTYEKMKDAKNAIKYKNLVFLLSDSINKASRKQLDNTLNTIVNKKNTEVKETKTKSIIITSLSIFAGLFASFFLYKKLKKSKLEKVQTTHLLEKEKQENTILESKLNDSFDELNQLAKENSPSFYVRFSEVYPKISQTLSKEYPQLSTFEKSFLAMVFLNFSNKELAKIESVSLKTIEIRKYRIRKKCNLESGQDLKKWLDDLALLETDYQLN